jgi:Tol biopolymer transport system component
MYAGQGNLYALPFDGLRALRKGDPFPVVEHVEIEGGHSPISAALAGTFVYRLVSGAAQRQLVWFGRDGKKLGAVGQPDESGTVEPEISPDGTHAAVVRKTDGNFDLWLVDIARGLFSRFTSDPALERWPTWSPDGTRLAFEQTNKILVKSLTTGSVDVLFGGDQSGKLICDWSRDGKFITYRSATPATNGDIWILPLTGDAKPFPFVNTNFEETRAQFSPDGHWISYESNASGRPEVYIKAFPGPAAETQISIDGGIEARWSPDGHEIFYISPEGKMMAAKLRVSPDGKTVTVNSPEDLFQTQIVSGGNQDSTFKFEYAVAKDGRFLVNSSIQNEATTPITAVLNWNHR